MYASDDSRAYFNSDNENVVLYNFALPDISNHTILGIEVQIEGRRSEDTASVEISLLWNSRSSATSIKSVSLIQTSDQIYTVGGADDTWGRTWSPEDFTNANFGMKLNGQVSGDGVGYIDHVQIKIYYQAVEREFDREFSFENVAVYDEDLELAIKTGQISNESLKIDMWNASSSSWFNILNINDIDDYTWKNTSISSYLPSSGSTLYFRFADSVLLDDSYSNTWQIDAMLIRYRLTARHFWYRRNVTIDHNEVGGSLTDFPVLIDLYDTGLHDDAQADGDDIIFTTPMGVKLAHQLEVFNQTYNSTYAHLIAWVKVPTLSSTSDTIITMYYGNATIINQEHPQSVWEANFQAVWHVNETVVDEGSVGNVHLDSGSNIYHGDQEGNDDIAGIIAQAQDFDGTDDLINVTTAKSLNPSANVTLSGWFKLDTAHSSASTTSVMLVEKYADDSNNMHILLVGTDYAIGGVADGALVFKVEETGDGMYKWTNQTSWAADTWYYFACVLDVNNPANNKIYINGVDNTDPSSVSIGGATSVSLAYSGSWGIGGGTVETSELVAGEAWLAGGLDEIRVTTTQRTAGWLLTEYNNQLNPSTFFSLRPEEHMEDLDPPTVVDFGVTDSGDGQPHFWVNVTDDFSGVFNVTLNLNGTEEHLMTLNSSGYWVYYPLAVNFSDYFTYQIVNSSDYMGRFLSTNSTVKNITFNYDTVAPSVDEVAYFPDLGINGTFNANVSDPWGEGIDTVIINITKVNGIPSTDWAYMRETLSGYINDTLGFDRASVLEFVITVIDLADNTNVSAPTPGYVGFNNAPTASNLILNPDPIHSNESLSLSYDFSDVDGDGETGTEIRWYKNGLLQPGHNDTTIIPASDLFKGDHWNATVRPKDWKEFGPLEASDVVTILNSQPVVSTIRFTFEHVGITPLNNSRDFVLEDEALTLTYSFFDADPVDSDESTVNWYLNDALQSQYTNWTTLPASITDPGDVWQAEIIPHDGEEASVPIRTKQMTVESRPDIHAYGIVPHSTAEGIYDIWIQADDERQTIDEVKFNITVNGLVVDGSPYIHRESVYNANTTAHWILERFNLLEILQTLPGYSETQFIDLLDTTLVVKVLVLTKVTYSSTEYAITQDLNFNFTLTDEAPPRVLDAGVEWTGSTPTNITFWATISEWGLGINEVLLFYEFTSIGAQTKFADLPYGPIPMSFNGTHYIATVAFSPDQIYDILFQLSVSDLTGNVNADAYPEGWSGGVRFTPPPIDLGPFLILFVIVIAIIGVIAVVAIRRFSGTEIELVGLDVDRVIEATAQVDKSILDAVMDDHTLGIVISFFDQRHGPVPIIVEPPILNDNFDKLLDLSDQSFNSCRFAENFEEEVLSFFDFRTGMDATVMTFTFCFSLNRPGARAGSEDITLNILVHQPYKDLVMQFIKQFDVPIHDIHVLMDKSPNEKEAIINKIIDLRRLISAIILAYEDIYGSDEEVEEEE